MRVPKLIRNLFPQRASALERRLHKRAVLYWQNALGEHEFVALADFDPQEIEDQSSHGFLLDLRQLGDPIFTYIGPVLEQEAGIVGDQVRFAAVPQSSLLKRFARHYDRVLASRAPETAEYDFMTDAGYHVLCRGALLPLSSDGAIVDHVYGVISWKSEKAAKQVDGASRGDSASWRS